MGDIWYKLWYIAYYINPSCKCIYEEQDVDGMKLTYGTRAMVGTPGGGKESNTCNDHEKTTNCEEVRS